MSTSSRKPMWILIAGFSSALVANGALVYYALNTWTGLETEQHYVKGLAYNDNLEAAKRQQDLGWQAALKAEFSAGDQTIAVSLVRFTDRNDRPLNDLEVRILATRPTHVGYDTEAALTPMGEGVYRAEIVLPLKGQWDFRILARRGEDDFQHVERIVTP